MRAVASVFVILLAACSLPRHAWQTVNIRDLSCSPFEIVVQRDRHFEVRRIRGVVMSGPEEPAQPIAGVSVTIRRLGKSLLIATTVSNDKGEFTSPVIADGWYQIETCFEGLNSAAAPVRVRHRAGERLIVLRLTISS